MKKIKAKNYFPYPSQESFEDALNIIKSEGNIDNIEIKVIANTNANKIKLITVFFIFYF